DLHIYQDVANIRNYFFKHLSGAKPLLSSIYKVGLENFGGMRDFFPGIPPGTERLFKSLARKR
ncbi:MAG: hypothetical protein PHT37_03855, partial [Candidatus Cloacimonetes bacterium]|nr:hypothetical protein [Candidatus Cloacimonadota bacterium]